MQRPRTLWMSVGYAVRGLSYAVTTQRNVRLHLGAGLSALALASWLEVSVAEWLVVCLTATLVLVAELLNTAVEAFVDMVSPEHREEARIIKDVAAGAVLACCASAVVVAGALLLPRLLHRLLLSS